MDENKNKEIFHSIFNKINNISVITGAIKDDLEHPDAGEACSHQLNSKLIAALEKIEEHVRALNNSLQEVYLMQANKKSSASSGPSK